MTIRRISGVLCLLVAAACGDRPVEVEIQVRPAPAVPVASPPFDDTFLQRLGEVVSAPVRDGKILNAAYVLNKDGVRVRTGYFGPHSAGNPEPVNDRSIYRLYSMTKIVTVAAVMKLHEAGKLELDAPIAEYLPELAGLEVLRRVDAFANPVTSPPARLPTVRDLLTHTAGFGYGSGRTDYVNARFDRDNILGRASLNEMTEAIAKIPLGYERGEGWEYSIASDIQGALIERISGQSPGSFMQAELFAPLGMADTGFYVDEAAGPRLTAITAWSPDGGRTAVGGPMASMAKAGLPLQSGGQGLVSTLADFEPFLLMLARKGELDGVRVLSRESVALMTSNALPVVDPYSGQEAVGPGFGRG